MPSRRVADGTSNRTFRRDAHKRRNESRVMGNSNCKGEAMSSGKLTWNGRVQVTLKGRSEDALPDAGMAERSHGGGKDTDSKEKMESTVARRKIGAPPNAYLFSVMGVAMVFVAMLFAFGEKTPDGKIDPMAIIQWTDGHRVWSHLLLLVLVAFEMAICDVCGWMLSAWIAQLRYRENITVRRVAFWRLGVQVAFATVVFALFALFPNAFPRNNHFPFLLLALVGTPVVFAALYLRRASKCQMQ